MNINGDLSPLIISMLPDEPNMKEAGELIITINEYSVKGQ